MTAVKVYRTQDGQIQVHKSRAKPWPGDIVSGFYWYGRKKHSPGRLPQWLQSLTEAQESQDSVPEVDRAQTVDSTQEVDQSDEKSGEDETSSNTDLSMVPQNESVTRADTGKYTLRKKVQPPTRFQ